MKCLGFCLLAAFFAFGQLAQAADAPPGFVMQDPPKPLPDIRFEDATAKPLGLADFRGKVVLLNVWATWCVPCRHEMPTLDRLQAALGGTNFVVLALSIDRAGMGAVDSFYSEIGIMHLAKYLDTSGEAAGRLGAFGLPTTLLIDRQGRELGRLIGPAEWDSTETIAFLQDVLAAKPAP